MIIAVLTIRVPFSVQAASRIDQLPVTTRQSLVMVTGSANRTLLPDQILKFCGALPIYNTEVVSNPIYENGNASKSAIHLFQKKSEA